jgi:hypothetical protein
MGDADYKAELDGRRAELAKRTATTQQQQQ